MKKSCPVILLAFALLAQACVAQPRPEPDEFEGADIDAVLKDIQLALQEVANHSQAKGLPDLATVTVTLETSFKKQVGTTFKFLVFSFGSKWSRVRSQQTVLTLAPPKPTEDPEIMGADVTENLAAAILSAANGVRDAANREPPLSLNRLQVDLSFVVEVSGGGSAGVTITPVTVDLGGDLSRKALHKLSVVFENKKP